MSKHKNVYAALMAARAEFPTVTRSETADAGKFKYKYAPLETIVEALEPVLAKFNLIVVQYPGLIDGQPVLHTELHHTESDTAIKGVYPLVTPAPGDPQKLGGSMTFARRYGYVCIVGLAIEDDDAQNASKPVKKPQVQATQDQLEAVSILAKAVGWSNDRLMNAIQKKTGKKDLRSLTEAQAEAVIQHLNGIAQRDRVEVPA